MGERKAIIAEYAGGPKQLEVAIADLPKGCLDFAENDTTWTIRQIVHHVADGDDIWKVFVKRAVGNPGGRFDLQWYWDKPQDEWVQSWAYAVREIEPSLALFRANRAHIVQLLSSIPSAWEQRLSVRWPSGEEHLVSVGWVVEMQARHVPGHVDDIRRARQAYGV